MRKKEGKTGPHPKPSDEIAEYTVRDGVKGFHRGLRMELRAGQVVRLPRVLGDRYRLLLERLEAAPPGNNGTQPKEGSKSGGDD